MNEFGSRAFRIAEVRARTGLGRTTIYAAIKAGDLIARKYRRTTVVLEGDLSNFLDALPTAVPSTAIKATLDTRDHVPSSSGSAAVRGRR
jgi:hypothetical protein